MPDKVLFVDDNPEILDAYQRTLHKHLPVEIAPGFTAALEMIRNSGPYNVVVIDIPSPTPEGIDFLARMQEISPDTVQMALTGYTGLKSVMDALERRNVFRYLIKPISPDSMVASLNAGLKQYRLQTDARMLRVLIDVMEMESAGLSRTEACATLRGRGGPYDIPIIDAVEMLGVSNMAKSGAKH